MERGRFGTTVTLPEKQRGNFKTALACTVSTVIPLRASYGKIHGGVFPFVVACTCQQQQSQPDVFYFFKHNKFSDWLIFAKSFHQVNFEHIHP